MNELLELARLFANDLSSYGQRGMASVRVEWFPYEGYWMATADWSDASKEVTCNHETPTQAMVALIRILSERLVQKAVDKVVNENKSCVLTSE